MRYLYKCNQCNHEFEQEHSLAHMVNAARQPKVKCPKCNGSTRKIINSTPIHFKGSGFYKTDNKK